MDAQDKIKKSAQALGVLLEIPAFVDPEKGFANEKTVKWENGDQIKIVVSWAEGAFNYCAFLGQIDPKSNVLAFLGGAIACAPSLESLIEQIDAYVHAVALERNDVDPAPEVVDAYNDLNAQYQELLLDPDHDVEQTYEMSQKLMGLEIQLRENGIKPGDLLV